MCTVAATLFLGGCASTLPPTSSPSSSQTAQPSNTASAVITIQDFAFGKSTSVPAGTTVTITNMDGQDHTVTADDGSFDVVVKGNGTASFTAPTKPGSYPFRCTFHPSMLGTLVVT